MVVFPLIDCQRINLSSPKSRVVTLHADFATDLSGVTFSNVKQVGKISPHHIPTRSRTTFDSSCLRLPRPFFRVKGCLAPQLQLFGDRYGKMV